MVSLILIDFLDQNLPTTTTTIHQLLKNHYKEQAKLQILKNSELAQEVIEFTKYGIVLKRYVRLTSDKDWAIKFIITRDYHPHLKHFKLGEVGITVMEWEKITHVTRGRVFDWRLNDKRNEHFIPPEMYNNKRFIMHGVKYSSHALEYAATHLKNDREIVMEGIKYRDTMLRYASNELINDPVIIMTALKWVPSLLTLRCVSGSTIMENQEILDRALSIGKISNERISTMSLKEKLETLVRIDFFFITKFRDVLKEEVRFIVHSQEFILQFYRDGLVVVKSPPIGYMDLIEDSMYTFYRDTWDLPNTIVRKTTHEYDKKLLESRGLLLEVLDESYRNDEEMVRTAIGQNKRAIRFASSSLRELLETK